MILTLEIQKTEPGLYQAHCTGEASPTIHNTIAAALRHYGEDIPPGFSRFAEVRYHGVSLGTTEITRLAMEPELMAQELVDLTATVYRSIEELKVTA